MLCLVTHEAFLTELEPGQHVLPLPHPHRQSPSVKIPSLPSILLLQNCIYNCVSIHIDPTWQKKKKKPTIGWKSVSFLRGRVDVLTFVWCFHLGHRDLSWSEVRVCLFLCSICGPQGVVPQLFIKCLLCRLACIRLSVESQNRETLSGTWEQL